MTAGPLAGGRPGARAATELDRWFRRQAAREQRIVVLEEAILGGRMWRYSWYRLRYFFLTYLVESAAHAVMVLLLARALGWENFLLVLVAHAGTALVSSFWWGALESMRAQVRDLHRSAQPHKIPAAIGGWLAFSLVAGAAFAVLGLGWTAWHALAGTLGAAEVLVATLLLRLALDIPARCYHSGIYALRRVYKPMTAVVAPELIGLALMLSLWTIAGVWALVVSSVVVTVLLTALTLLYTRRVYHFLGFAPVREATRAAVPAALRGRGRELLAGGVSHAVMALDSLVVLALLYGASTDSQALVVLFLVSPTIRAGADWARLLYFDLKRLELRLFTNLRRRFERHAAHLAVLLGLVFWAVAAGIATAYYEGGLGDLYLALLGFFLARSLLAKAQIQAFAEGSYGAVIATGLACVAGLAAVGPLADGEAERMAGVAIATALAAAVLGRVTGMARERGEPGQALLTMEWLRRLGEVRSPVRVGSARIVSAGGPDRLDARSRDDRNRWRLSQLAGRAARRLGMSGAAGWVGPDRMIWFELPGDGPRIDAAWLQKASGGLVADVMTRDCADGEEAILAAARGEMLGQASSHLLTAILPVDVGAARRTFEELVPDGVVYAADEPVPPELAALPGRELRAILVDAANFARDLAVRRRQSRFDVTALCAGGELRLVFVADVHAGRRARGRWRHRVTALNVRAAIAGARARSTHGPVGGPALERSH